MSTPCSIDTEHHAVAFPGGQTGPWERIYRELFALPQAAQDTARSFLDEQLQQAARLPCPLPHTPSALPSWSRRHAEAVTGQYAGYLAARREGGARRYFTHRAQALHFLRAVAPTKLVDGAWLYGTLPYWRELRLQPLVRTYLEELGDGVPAQNHALLFRRLLATHGCDDLGGLDDSLYRQGAIQLALGQLTEEYLPEVIGYNLGYEQLPLHLLISAFELDELDIDPYYFQLHVTIDNSASGHAAKAVQAVLDNLPLVENADAFYRRVSAGYRLNDLGPGSAEIIAGFDLEEALIAMLERKRVVAGHVHSDYCRIGGRTINQWLNADEEIAGFLNALQQHGWIKRHHDPAACRFWMLVQGEGAAMFGVFSPYEQQLLYDWIAGDWGKTEPSASAGNGIFRHRYRRNRAALHAPSPRAMHNELDREQRALSTQLQSMSTSQREARLIELLAPACHATPAGLLATREFSTLTR